MDQEGAGRLWAEIHQMEYKSWGRPPKWSTRQPSTRAHGETADVFINPVIESALDETGLEEWPEGSTLVKDSYEDSDPTLIAAMQKQEGRWFFAEWDSNGEAKYAGYPDVCVRCHEAGADFVLTAALP